MHPLLTAVFTLFASTALGGSLTAYQAVDLDCAGGLHAIRSFTQEGRSRLLVVNTKTLVTSLRNRADLKCQSGMRPKSPYAQALDKYSAPTPTGADGQALEVFANFGVKSFPKNCGGQAQPMVITADLCPSSKSTDKAYLATIAKHRQAPTPMVLAVSGQWLRTHAQDIAWIRMLNLSVTFANHSDKHTYVKHLPYDKNFMTQESAVEFQTEIFDAEKTMIELGLTPSIFFRFPGLMSTRAQIQHLKNLGLVSLGTTAWLALDGSVNKPFSDYFRRNGPSGFADSQKAEAGRVILTHANGNEFYGVKKAEGLIQKLGARANFISLEQAVLCDLSARP